MIVSKSKYRFCKVFVKGGESDALMAMLATLLDGHFQRHSMFLRGFVVDVRRNPDAADAADPGDDFVRWPVLVELEAEEEVGERALAEAAAEILRALWDAGYPAVAACDFEDELPWSGGIQRLHG